MKTNVLITEKVTLSTRERKALSLMGYKYTPRTPLPNEAKAPACDLFARPVWDGRVIDPRRVSL